MSRRPLAVVAALVSATIVVGSASAATAPLRISHVDTARYPTVAVTLTGLSSGGGALPSVSFAQNGGSPVPGVPDLNGTGEAIELLIDTSNSMHGKPLAEVTGAAAGFLSGQSPNTQLGVIGIAAKPYVASPLSAGSTNAVRSVAQLATGGPNGTAIYGAVEQASHALAAVHVDRRVIVLFTDGFSVGEKATLAQAISAARSAGVQVYTVGTSSSPQATGPLTQIAQSTGGRFVPAADASKVAAAFTQISQSLQSAVTFTFRSDVPAGERFSLAVTASNGQSAATSVLAPGKLPTTTSGGGGLPLPGGTGGRVLIAGVAALLVMGGALILLSTRRDATVTKRIAPHVEQKAAAKVVLPGADIPNMSVLHQLFVATEKVAGSLKYWQRLSFRLEQANLPLRTAEVVYMQLGCALAFGLVGSLVFGSVGVLALIPMLIGAALPMLYVRFKASRRMRQFENQLPETLITMAASLKAGHAFNSALNSVVKEGAPPTSDELARVASEIQLGMSSEEALEAMASRMGSANFGFVVMAVNIQRTVGGSLADILDMVADTVRQRQQFSKKVKALTAQGRMSAYVLLAMPFLMALAIYVIQPHYMSILFTNPIGQVLIGGSLVMMGIGAVILRKIVSFKG